MFEGLLECTFFLKIMNVLLSTKDKLIITTLNKSFRKYKFKFTYDEYYVCNNKCRKKWYFNQLTNVRIRNSMIPNRAVHLEFDNNFSENFAGDVVIPNSVTHLIFDGNFIPKIIDKVSKNVISVKFCRRFDTNIIEQLSDSIMFIELPLYCQQKISKLPKCLKILICSEYFYVNNLKLISEREHSEYLATKMIIKFK